VKGSAAASRLPANKSLSLPPKSNRRHCLFGYDLGVGCGSRPVTLGKLPMVNKDQGPKARPTPDREDQRGTARHGVLRQGKISFDGRTVYCAVRDFSVNGARLQVGVELPEIFNLAVAGHEGDLRAEFKWRKGEDVGVVFQEQLKTEEVEAIRPRPRLMPRRRKGERPS
jgi:hypothetical protein